MDEKTTCRVCGRERESWQVKEYPDGATTFLACVDVIDCGPEYEKKQRQLDKAAFAALGIDYDTYSRVFS